MKIVKNNKIPNRSLSIYLRPSIRRLLDLRLVPRNTSAAIDAAIGRYLSICDRHRPELSPAQMLAVVESIPLDASGVAVASVPWSAVDEAHSAGRLDHLDVDAGSLVQKLKGLSPVEETALIEMVERKGNIR